VSSAGSVKRAPWGGAWGSLVARIVWDDESEVQSSRPDHPCSEQAHKSATMASTWVNANIADRVRPLTTQIGNLALFHGMPVAV
jgi:hypothetical protein